MKEDFSELVEYLDKKFEQTASKEDMRLLSARVIGVEEDIKEMKKDIVTLQETVRDLATSIDHLVKAIDDLRIEYSAMAMQLTRHEKWIQQLADKLGIKLAY